MQCHQKQVTQLSLGFVLFPNLVPLQVLESLKFVVEEYFVNLDLDLGLDLFFHHRVYILLSKGHFGIDHSGNICSCLKLRGEL